MTDIVICLNRGPDDQPVGQLRAESGDIIEFTGWLSLIRALEDQLRQAPPPGPGADPSSPG